MVGMGGPLRHVARRKLLLVVAGVLGGGLVADRLNRGPSEPDFEGAIRGEGGYGSGLYGEDGFGS